VPHYLHTKRKKEKCWLSWEKKKKKKRKKKKWKERERKKKRIELNLEFGIDLNLNFDIDLNLEFGIDLNLKFGIDIDSSRMVVLKVKIAQECKKTKVEIYKPIWGLVFKCNGSEK
jgi:hypothetical protein